MSREKNNGDTCSPPFQFVLKLEAANTGKPYIQNQATGTVAVSNR